LGTTDKFLEHFGLESLDVLPGRAELEAEGLLSDVIPDGFYADGTSMHNEAEDMGPEIETEEESDFVTDYIGEDAEEVH
ncbi:MAG: SMC-Scp complex subunit ScpB, partial [Henriciella sp.]|nr:SMC-Scp complex subunit ScpB [Henriciella sp.]